MTYELKLEKFSGPLEKLLELLEERKLQIGEVSLAQVTDDFLRYLKGLASENPDLRMIADFIAVASKLILVKSKYLLPDLTLTSEEEEGIEDLEKRLRLYQELRPAMKLLASFWRKKNNSFSRPYFLARGFAPDTAASGIFYPGAELDAELLFGSLRNIFDSLQTYELETQTIKDKIVSIEEKMQEIIGRLEAEKETAFASLASTKSRTEIIVIFLAILHLAREQLIMLEQAGHFGEIKIRKQEAKDQGEQTGQGFPLGE